MPTTTTPYTEQAIQAGRAQWQRCYQHLQELIPNADDVTRWINPIVPRAYVAEEKQMVVAVPSEPFAAYLEEHYTKPLNEMMESLLPGVALIFEYLESAPKPEATPEVGRGAGAVVSSPDFYMSPFREEYSFDNYFESASNRVARAIGESVAKKPGQAPHNLLFLYGHSGVGKTHLVQAIGQRVRLLHPELKVCYVSAEKFTLQYAHDSRFNGDGHGRSGLSGRAAFISFYQQMDVLIIDDIQNLINKEKSQVAFFEIFNHLTLLNKQIILTCDVPPTEMRGEKLEERLRTRILSSMSIELQRPDLELRRKILTDRLKKSEVIYTEDAIEYLINTAPSNVREIEGMAKNLWVRSYTTHKPIDLDEAHTVVGHSITVTQTEVSMEDIIRLITEEYNVEEARLLDSSRKAEVVLPRHMVMYLGSQYTKLPQQAIAARLKRKNHTTVINAIKAIRDRIDTNAEFREQVARLEGLLFGRGQ